MELEETWIVLVIRKLILMYRKKSRGPTAYPGKNEDIVWPEEK